jgi:histidinol dehydrogenase
VSILRRLVWADADEAARAKLLRRSAVPDPEVRAGAIRICDDVEARGTAAVIEYAERFGGGFRRVTAEELEHAREATPADTQDAIRASASAVETYHRTQLPTPTVTEPTPGVRIERRWTPLDRVGCYVPGGKAAYPSTVVMTTVPARVAGVAEVVVASPAGPDGSVDPTLAAACAILGVDELWAIGGAQAIAALAHGTGDLRRVQKIVGPGNSLGDRRQSWRFTVTVAIDLPAGPSEVLVIADDTADPRTWLPRTSCARRSTGPTPPPSSSRPTPISLTAWTTPSPTCWVASAGGTSSNRLSAPMASRSWSTTARR